MPPAFLNNASPSAMLRDKPREMDAVAAERQTLAICPTDDDEIAPKTKKPNKQSLDYVWRSGLAGGLAGSAVCDTQNTRDEVLIVCYNRPKQSSLLSTASRSFSKPAIPNSQSTPAPGSESRPL